MTNLSELLERVEKAEPLQYEEIDRDIMAMEGWEAFGVNMTRDAGGGFVQIRNTANRIHYTSSLDAVVGLIEREMPERLWVLMNRALREVSRDNAGLVGSNITADKIRRALLAAFLRAKIEMEAENA